MQRNAPSSSASTLPLAIRLRYWPTALQLLFMRAVALLPLPAIRALGAMLGTLLWPLARERRQITLRNLELCFPTLTAHERVALAKQNFRNTATGFLETAKVWFTDAPSLARYVEIEGLEHLQRAAANGKGVLVLGFHLTDLELGATALAPHCQLAGMYRPHANPVFEQAMRAGRERHFPMIPRDDVRAMVRWLKSGGCVWYAADQDYGAQHSVFAPFFGIPTATITATSRFAKLSGAAVVPFTHVRTARGINLILHPPLTTIPSDDEAADAITTNAFLEQWLREHPADYLWLHRRFKTRPDEQPSLYAAKRARYSGNEVSAKRLTKLLKSAQRVSLQSDAAAPVWLTSGNRLVQICSTSLWWRLRHKLTSTEWRRGDNSLLPVTVVSPMEVWHCSTQTASVLLFDPLLRPLTESLGQVQHRKQWLAALAHQFAVLHAAQMRLASPDIGSLVTTSRHELAWLPFGTRQQKRDTADSRLRELAAISQQCAESCQAEPNAIWDALIASYIAHAAVPEPLRDELNAKSSTYRPGMSS